MSKAALFLAVLILLSVLWRRCRYNRQLSVGNVTSKILYPSRLHATKVKELFLERKNLGGSGKRTGLLLFGNKAESNKYCDTVRKFRQERYFYYLSGVELPGCAIIHDFWNDKVILFLPNVNQDDILWSGMPLSLKEAKEKYECDEVYHLSSLDEVLKEQFSEHSLFTTDTDNFDSDYAKSVVRSSDKDLFYSLKKSRMHKDWYEIRQIKEAVNISERCHRAIISRLSHLKAELDVQAEFVYEAKRQGARILAYDPVCAAGANGGILHYVKNRDLIKNQVSLLVDAGVEFQQYASDITRSLPLGGKFTHNHRLIYDAVLDMQKSVAEKMKPGVYWEALHLLSHKILIKHLLRIGIFRNEFSELEIFNRKATIAFYPHGIGHLIGLDVHDCGTNTDKFNDDLYFTNLRFRGKLEEGMAVTNEPGCYFNHMLMKKYLFNSPERLQVVNLEVLKLFFEIGGVRIEDCYHITRMSNEKLGSLPSNPDEIEELAAV